MRSMADLTDIERLSLFKDVANEYFDMSAAFPIDNSNLTSIPGFTRASDRWHQLVRAFALRKFFLTKSDNVHCHKVYLSYQRAVSEPIETDMTLEEYFTSVAGLVGLDLELPDGGIPVRDVVNDLLYGAFLHGDPAKLKRVKDFRRRFDEDWAIRKWTEEAHTHLEWLYHQVLRAEVKGRLAIP